MQNNSRAIQQNKYITIGEPHDQGLVFKWGSLVGISMPSEGANATLPFVAANAVFRPSEFTGTITNDWTSVPWCTTDFGNYGNTATDHLSQVHNPTTGVGDICRYMGVVDGTCWRMPTQSEWDELYRNGLQNGGESTVLPNDGSGWVLGSFHPLSGRAFGPHQSRITIASNTQVDNADPYDAGAVFLPASGYRLAAGAIYYIGSYGFYRSSTAQSAGNGYLIMFNSTTVWPQQSNPRTYAFSVRCIRE